MIIGINDETMITIPSNSADKGELCIIPDTISDQAIIETMIMINTTAINVMLSDIKLYCTGSVSV